MSLWRVKLCHWHRGDVLSGPSVQKHADAWHHQAHDEHKSVHQSQIREDGELNSASAKFKGANAAPTLEVLRGVGYLQKDTQRKPSKYHEPKKGLDRLNTCWQGGHAVIEQKHKRENRAKENGSRL